MQPSVYWFKSSVGTLGTLGLRPRYSCHRAIPIGQAKGSSTARLGNCMIVISPQHGIVFSREGDPHPISPASIRPQTKIATSDSPVAIVQVKAVLRTLTALSHGSLRVWHTRAAVRKGNEGARYLRQRPRNAARRGRGRFV
jgi:hypothetical protein